MRKGSFTPFAAPPIQLPALLPTPPPSVGPESLFLFGRLVGPASALLPTLRDIRSHATLGQPRHQTIIVIALVHHRFRNRGIATRQHEIGLGQTQCPRPPRRIGWGGERDGRR